MNTIKIKKAVACAITLMSLSACDLISPSDIVNPNVDEDTFKKTPNALRAGSTA